MAATSLLMKLNKAQLLAQFFKQCVAEGHVLIRRFNVKAAKPARRLHTKGIGSRSQKDSKT
ncbi:hypothetical protein [Paucibacter sp. KCTC 42545]|uniref:hypothetical protein n=1 Tax=Paucibacter sp. KCTC 42545 TaxID=1768242 RepID=UPI0012E3A493|nr:hypothetical protein [Paucibacter sp. KCTC 42545]